MNETAVDIQQAEKPYTFRKLEAPDIFLMFKIISAIGVNEFKVCFEAKGFLDLVQKLMADKGEKPKTDDEFISVGAAMFLDLAQVVVTNLPKCEREIYQMLANVANMKVEAVKKLDAITFFEMVIDFLKKEEFADFIKVVSKLFK